jgi:hypothetical protein
MGRDLQSQLADIRDQVPVADNNSPQEVQDEQQASEGDPVVKRPVRRRERRASNERVETDNQELEEDELTEAQKTRLFEAQIAALEAERERALEEARRHRGEKFLNRSIGGSLIMMAAGAFAVIAQALVSDKS